MCLYPRLIRNKKYLMYNVKPNKRKPIDDYRKEYVAVGCGNCIECRKQKAREWQVRLGEELKIWRYKYFVTLTFSPEQLEKLCKEKSGYTNVNYVARDAVRRFLERWRKKYKKSVKHWLITELGHEGTERIHLHGIIFTNFQITNEEIAKIWQYGNTYTGNYCNEKTVNYIVKYVTKIDIDHKGYKADIFCSAGLGRCYVDRESSKLHHEYKGKDTIQYYTLKNGTKVALPKYYRNLLFTQDERDKMWTQILDADKTYVRGIEVRHISKDGYNQYLRLLGEQQKVNRALGYGDCTQEWSEKQYKVTLEMLNKQ